jgi:protein phosphatase
MAELRRPRDRINWSVKKITGTAPGGRYGHTMAYLKPYIIIFGGNIIGSESINDAWICDVLAEGSNWFRLEVG